MAKIVENTVQKGNNKVTSNMSNSGHTSLFLIEAAITVLYIIHLYQMVFFVHIGKTTFLSIWNGTNTCLSMRFSEQSNRFKGLHCNKTVKNTDRQQQPHKWLHD